MFKSDFDEFVRLLDATCSVLSRGAYVPNATNSAIWFRALAAHDLATVRAAFDAHTADPQRGRFVPVPADILAQINAAVADDGRPGAEEAWATAVTAVDEAETVVWTAETSEAWRIAQPVLEGGDEVGARMAFKESYARLVQEAREKRLAPAWSVSQGHDPALRHIAVERATSAGLLRGPELLALPAPAGGTDGMARLIDAAPDGVRERLELLRKEYAAKILVIDGLSADVIADRERTEALKADTARRVAETLEANGRTDSENK
jgi:hypothetical protein